MYQQLSEGKFPISVDNLSSSLEPWVKEAEKRIFSLAAGNRLGDIAPKIMSIGLAKILYAANELGADIDAAKPYMLFAPDGTITFNGLRIKRCFSYGGILSASFGSLIATNNSMPNGCGFSLFELDPSYSDEKLLTHLHKIDEEMKKDDLKNISKGNHFACLYEVKDATTGEDTGRRIVMIHCSGKESRKEKIYHTDWLSDLDGYHAIDTPHGKISLLESDAKNTYLEEFHDFDQTNLRYKHKLMADMFNGFEYSLLTEITHQGLTKDGKKHLIGSQSHEEGIVPIAFNAEEGSILVKIKKNLSKEFIERWKYADTIQELGYGQMLQNSNIAPHGGGYELKYPIETFKMLLDKEGLNTFTIHAKPKINQDLILTSHSFKQIREHIVYRRKLPLMKEIFKAELVEHICDLKPLKQIYPPIRDQIYGIVNQ